jgi:hypothetical protein
VQVKTNSYFTHCDEPKAWSQKSGLQLNSIVENKKVAGRKSLAATRELSIYVGVVCAPAANRSQAGGATMETAPAVTII